VLGFILCGEVHVHDKLRLIPGEKGKSAEVKGIQVSDEDYESAGRGIRVGLSLRGIELKDLAKTSWLDDGSLATASRLTFDFTQSPYFRQPVAERDLHLQAPGELLVARITQGSSKTELQANLQSEAPVWNGMKVALVRPKLEKPSDCRRWDLQAVAIGNHCHNIYHHDVKGLGLVLTGYSETREWNSGMSWSTK